jgi:hypothetical protein
MTGASAVVVTFSAVGILFSSLYFRRFRIARPPIGVFNLRDLVYMMLGVVLVPFLYLVLPIWSVAALLILSAASLLYFTWEPVVRTRWATWLATIAVLGADIWSALQYSLSSQAFSLVNDVVVVIIVVGVTNLWAQSGMKAREVTILSGGLMIYDFTATTLLPFMGDVMERLVGLPLSPQVAWGTQHTAFYASIGLGDLLMASIFPMIMRKAYGPAAGYSSIAISIAAILGMFVTPIGTMFPAMIILAPLAIVQYVYWLRRYGAERSTQEYLQMEPLPSQSYLPDGVR